MLQSQKIVSGKQLLPFSIALMDIIRYAQKIVTGNSQLLPFSIALIDIIHSALQSQKARTNRSLLSFSFPRSWLA